MYQAKNMFYAYNILTILADLDVEVDTYIKFNQDVKGVPMSKIVEINDALENVFSTSTLDGELVALKPQMEKMLEQIQRLFSLFKFSNLK